MKSSIKPLGKIVIVSSLAALAAFTQTACKPWEVVGSAILIDKVVSDIVRADNESRYETPKHRRERLQIDREAIANERRAEELRVREADLRRAENALRHEQRPQVIREIVVVPAPRTRQYPITCERTYSSDELVTRRRSGRVDSEKIEVWTTNCPDGYRNNGGRMTVADLQPGLVAKRYRLLLADAQKVISALAAIEENPESTATVLGQLGLGANDIELLKNGQMPTNEGIDKVSETLDQDPQNTTEMIASWKQALVDARMTVGAMEQQAN